MIIIMKNFIPMTPAHTVEIEMMLSKKEIIFIFLRCAVAMTLFTVAIVKYDYLSTLDITSLSSITSSLPLLILLVELVYIVKALVFVIPASLVYVAVGVIMNPYLAVGVNLLGILLEVSVTYWLGYFLGKEAVVKILSKKEAGRKLLAKNVQDKISVLIGIRAIPAFPIDFVSLFYGVSGCSFIKYALFSVLGISWRVILFTLIGSEVFDWIPFDKIILVVICCIPVGVAVYLYKKFHVKKTTNEITNK